MNVHVPAQIKFAAEIENVKEVVVAGNADLIYWTGILSQQHLRPLDTGGYAEILTTATELKWKGIKFREFTISITAAADEDRSSDKSYYLIQAYNSVCLLSFSERIFFSTPYNTASIMLHIGVTPGINLIYKRNKIFNAAAAKSSVILSEADESWRGKVYLPGSGKKYFIAELSGYLKRFSFKQSESTFNIQPVNAFPVFKHLINSGFDPYEWRIRESAVHKKSKTFR